MPRAKLAILGRLGLYTALGVGLIAALAGGPLLPSASPARDPVPADLRAAQLAIIQSYIASAAQPPPAAAVARAVEALPEEQRLAIIEWLPTTPEERPSALFHTALPRQSPLFADLLMAALTGRQSPPLEPEQTQRLIEGLPVESSDPLLLRVLEQTAARTADAAPALHLALLVRAARHPKADWSHLENLVRVANDLRQPGPAASFLQDWLDAPPPHPSPEQRHIVRRHLANLHLLADQPDAAWSTLEPLLTTASPTAATLDEATLTLAWTVATLVKSEGRLLAPLEAHLSRHPAHQRHWRELATEAAPASDYLLWLPRLARACLTAGQDSRAIALHLHLACLSEPTELVPILPLAIRMKRLPEILDCIDSLDRQRPRDDKTPLLIALATTCLERGDAASATQLIQQRLLDHPQDPQAARLQVRIAAQALSPLQAAMQWTRHLRRHPTDLAARRLGLQAWLQAGQPQAAVNQLLAAPADLLINFSRRPPTFSIPDCAFGPSSSPSKAASRPP